LQPTAIEDPKTLVELYRNGAVNAKEAGFDGVEREYY
jgi:2,4-dienoyl-CoA reductase-like NADH-dependent reductase (Old Yellow Enzyme family)